MATPHVTGIVALMMERKCLEPELVRQFIFIGASQYNNPDDFNGYGIVNAKKTINALDNSQINF
ncbi:MAG: hypothetical protein ACPL7B_10865 [Candidatus Poribacteria bacterium]